jgi:type IV secretory pathway VirB3-like protein
MLLTFLPRRLLPGVVPVEVLVFGGVMLVIIVLIHGAGLDRIVARYRRKADILRARGWHPHVATYIFAAAILLMLLLHITEACIWGVVLNKIGLISNLRDSIYFSANTYTMIGYGQMILPYEWRELSPIMAISGLFTFAWTTGEMFNVVHYRHDLVAELAARRKEKSSKHEST